MKFNSELNQLLPAQGYHYIWFTAPEQSDLPSGVTIESIMKNIAHEGGLTGFNTYTHQPALLVPDDIYVIQTNDGLRGVICISDKYVGIQLQSTGQTYIPPVNGYMSFIWQTSGSWTGDIPVIDGVQGDHQSDPLDLLPVNSVLRFELVE